MGQKQYYGQSGEDHQGETVASFTVGCGYAQGYHQPDCSRQQLRNSGRQPKRGYHEESSHDHARCRKRHYCIFCCLDIASAVQTPTHIQQKLREEITAYMPFLFKECTRNDMSLLQTAEVDALPYLENVTRESLRYIPSIPLTVRQSLKDDQLGRYFVPAGTTIYVIANCINRMESFWGSTANVFDPDRWDNLPTTFTPNAFMTFLHSPRGCVGRNFAEIEMKIILCSLLSKFEFAVDNSWQDPEELKMWRLVLRPRDGINLKVTRVDA